MIPKLCYKEPLKLKIAIGAGAAVTINGLYQIFFMPTLTDNGMDKV